MVHINSNRISNINFNSRQMEYDPLHFTWNRDELLWVKLHFTDLVVHMFSHDKYIVKWRVESHFMVNITVHRFSGTALQCTKLSKKSLKISELCDASKDHYVLYFWYALFSTCHGTGKDHNSTLHCPTKPILENFWHLQLSAEHLEKKKKIIWE